MRHSRLIRVRDASFGALPLGKQLSKSVKINRLHACKNLICTASGRDSKRNTGLLRPDQGWLREPGLPQEPGRQRSDDGPSATGRGAAATQASMTPTSSWSTPARSSPPPSRNRSTPFWKWRSTRARGAPASWWWRAAWWNVFATRFAEHPGSGRGGRHRRAGSESAAAGIASAPPTDSPFRILPSRAEGDARAAQGRFSRESWDGAIADFPNYLYDEATPRVLATPRHAAYIKIAEGCDHPCTFCIIPQLRGKFRSRRFESVIAEAERLARSGVREITLIGQDTTCYGEDFGLKDGLAAPARESWPESKTCAGCAFSTPIPTRSRAGCSKPSPPTTRSVPTLMCRCSTHRRAC